MAKKKNTGTGYEILVKQIFGQILCMDGLKNLRVEHNVKLDAITRGKNGQALKRQIDVYWEFEAGGVVHKAVVQAKDLTRRITLGMVDTFKSVLDDLPGQPRGIMVTNVGFQSGAQEYAEARGIALYLLREPDASQDGIKQVSVIFKTVQRTLESFSVEVDVDWIRAHGGVDGVEIQYELNPPVCWENGHVYGRLNELQFKAMPDHDEPGRYTVTHKPAPIAPMFIMTKSEQCPRLKISSVTAVVTQATSAPAHIQRMMKHVLQTVVGDKKYLFDQDAQLIENNGAFMAHGQSGGMGFSAINIDPGTLPEDPEERRKFLDKLSDAAFAQYMEQRKDSLT